MANQKILLTILPLLWPKMPSLGLAYLQSFLANKGIVADTLDLNNVYYNLAGEKLKKSWLISCNKYLEENIISIIKTNFPAAFKASINQILQYDIVGFSCFKSNFKNTLKIIKILKTKKMNMKIILGGPEITRQFFKTRGRFNEEMINLADYIVVGEGERGLYDFVAGQTNNVKVSEFLQLQNLEHLPYPKFQGIDFNSYPRKDALPLQLSRGCTQRCNFCSERLLYKGFRTRPIENIIQEIRYHLINNKTRYFVFFDSILNGDTKKLQRLCDEIINNFGAINWEAQIAIRDNMEQAIFEKMQKSGCYNLFIGLESGSDNTLKRMNKGFGTKQAHSFFKKLKFAGLSFGVSLIIGYPGETEQDFKESLDFIIQNKELIPKIEQVNPFTYYHGTDAEENADYKLNPDSIKRTEIFIEQIKKNNFRYTNAFLRNLMEKNGDGNNRN